MHRSILLAALTALLAVALGAFAAHGLRGLLEPERLTVFRTGVEYQMWHALGLGLIGVLLRQYPGHRLLLWAGRLMFAGIVLFSGSLYLLSLAGLRWVGMITPFGGVAFIAAWALLAAAAWNLEDRAAGS